MDFQTLMALISSPQPHKIQNAKLDEGRAEPGTAAAPAAVTPPPYYPGGTPIVAPPTAPTAPAAPMMNKGGFSASNILSALLGSNFGVK
jgi:hypothetical protein